MQASPSCSDSVGGIRATSIPQGGWYKRVCPLSAVSPGLCDFKVMLSSQPQVTALIVDKCKKYLSEGVGEGGVEVEQG